MTTEAEKAVKAKLKEMAQALFPFAGSVTWDADMVRKEMGDVLTIGHVMGAASRDGEVAKLEARVKELEHKLNMRRSSVRDALERNGLNSESCQGGIDDIDLMTGKIR